MFLNFLIAISALFVVGSLVLGIVSLVKGGEFSQKYSNRFMRWRVTGQAIAIGLLVIAVLMKSQGS